MPSLTLGMGSHSLFNPIPLAYNWYRNGHVAHFGSMRLKENFAGVSGEVLCSSGRVPCSSNPVSLLRGSFMHRRGG